MSGGADESDFGGLDLEAAEYVLGTLDYRERAVFAERIRNDPAAGRAVADWERRFAGLEGAAGSVAPPGEVWSRIERAIGANGVRAFRVVEGGASTGASALRAALERSRDRWRLAAFASGLVAAAFAIYVIGDQSGIVKRARPAEAGTYVAAVNRGGDKPALIVRVDLSNRRVYIHPVAAEAPQGHSLELWYIGAGQSPKPMGLVDQTTRTADMPPDATDATATFAVSVEPVGGSTTGSPTGPVIYSGQLVKD